LRSPVRAGVGQYGDARKLKPPFIEPEPTIHRAGQIHQGIEPGGARFCQVITGFQDICRTSTSAECYTVPLEKLYGFPVHLGLVLETW
jgi:hypothetical protein